MLKPKITRSNLKFWEGLSQHKLLAQKCTNCHRYIFPPRSICPSCLSQELDWVQLSGRATLYSYTQVHLETPGIESPWILGILELVEGFRLVSKIQAQPEQLRIGMELQLDFQETPWGKIFVWKPME